MEKVRWGILGPGRIARAFATGVGEADHAELVAVGSRSEERSRQFGAEFGAAKYHGSYEALYADPSVEAIYIATPHPFHKAQALAAIAAGKHLLLEKPAALTAADVREIVAAARGAGRFFLEGYMYLHQPQIAAALEIVAGLGPVQHVQASFCFDTPFDPKGRHFAPALAGGGILDVGGYVVSAASLFAGMEERQFAAPKRIVASGLLAETGVDAFAMAQLHFPGGITAELRCAVARELGQEVKVFCKGGALTISDPWLPGNTGGPVTTRLTVEREGTTEVHEIDAPAMLYTYEAEAASRAIRDGRAGLDYPIPSAEASVLLAEVLETWRRQVVGS